ncbi:hypothetical protein T296_04795 [Pantoea agglomerans Eh318]|nr:hypothetical protein T296_04795 [Pantoea agglomerans Eh318]
MFKISERKRRMGIGAKCQPSTGIGGLNNGDDRDSE